MSRISYLQDLLASLFERREGLSAKPEASELLDLCRSLLDDTGEFSRLQSASALLDQFAIADAEQKLEFFKTLASEFDIDLEQLEQATSAYGQNSDAAALTDLLEAAEPRRQELLRRLNAVPGGTEKLVRMREDLLKATREDTSLARMDVGFERLFSSWFNRGFLVLKPIDWTTPAHILEKIIKYEAVHAIDSWDDLRRRLQPEDRRCFAFFHPAMPDEPLIFVEVALMKGIPGSIQSVLSEDRDPQSPQAADTAVFYSISNCQKGLRGVSFGNFLIKQVAQDLALDLPNINTFVTLSPIPGFTNWLKQTAEREGGDLLERIQLEASMMTPENVSETSVETANALKALAARYFLQEKRPKGGPVDPVARFHLGNGASLKALHWLGDSSENGIRQSASMMVNYHYDLKTVNANHESFSRDGKVIASREITSLTDPRFDATRQRKKSHG